MFFRRFFYFQRSDRMATAVILLLLTVALTVVGVVGLRTERTPTAASDSVASPPQGHGRRYARPDLGGMKDAPGAALSPFDPNTADSTRLLSLGLSPWQVRAIYRYRAKGGVYREPNAFARVPGMTKKQFEALRPYIRISDDYAPASEFYTVGSRRPGSSPSGVPPSAQAPSGHVGKLRQGEHVDLNSADTTVLKSIPGIGSGYARAIVNYRTRLGGFYSARQLLEVGGVPESALPYVTVDGGDVKRLRINTMSVNQLRRHPYLNFYQARDIYDYRRLHGPLTTLRVLANSPNFTPADLERLEHYVEY